MTVAVVTDSSVVFPPAWADGLPLHVVPLQLAWDGGSEVTDDMPYRAFADRMARGDAPPQTSAPSPGAYQEAIEEILSGPSTHVLVITPAAELSTTHDSARLAARDLGAERVAVLDARTAAAGQGMVAVEAARLAAGGADLAAVSARAHDVASLVETWATVSDLGPLARSGRVPSIVAVAGSALSVQPIVRFKKGDPRVVGVAVRAPAARLIRAWQRRRGTGRVHALAFHSAREAEAADLIARIDVDAPDAVASVCEVNASHAAHTGAGLLGLAWWAGDDTPHG